MLAAWIDVKNILISRNLSAQYTIAGPNYWIKAIDGAFELECILPTDTTRSADSLDFVTNFKDKSNQSQVQITSVQAQPPYGSKTVVVNGITRKLYARTTGLQFSLVAGSNTLTYTATFAWAKLLGVEATNTEALDTVDFEVYDNSSGTYSGTPNALLNQFGFAVNMPKDFYKRMPEFDADLYAGMVVKLTYTSISNKTLGVNLILNEVV